MINIVTGIAGIVLRTAATVAVEVGDYQSDHMPMQLFVFTVAAIAHFPRQCRGTS